MGIPKRAAYAASKLAAEGLLLAIAPKVECFSVRLTLVKPEFFRTELLDAQNAYEVLSNSTDGSF